MKVYVHLATGFEEIEAITVIDVLRRADIDVESISITGDKLVVGAHGIGVEADQVFEKANYENCQMIILPGGIPGTPNLNAHKGLMNEIRNFASSDRLLAAICAAPMILGEAGLLKGKTAVIYPGMEIHLKDAEIGKDTVAIDGNIITSKGPGTAMDFALAIVGLLKDQGAVDDLKSAMLLK